jgi:hypothetical protein
LGQRVDFIERHICFLFVCEAIKLILTAVSARSFEGGLLFAAAQNRGLSDHSDTD